MDYENLTPQYRIEEYLEAIVEGWADATMASYPDYPSWRLEEFLDAFITYIWEDGDHPRHPCPEPAWRLEECLRAIYDVITGAATPWPFPLPPTNRIEEYLAAIHAYLADGTEVPVPEPVWRIEQWLAYVLDAVKQGGGIEKTVSGTMVHITDALAKAALSVLASIEPIQDLHGYANPWPAGGGVNIMPTSAAATKTNNGVTIATTGNGVYTFSGTALTKTTIVFDLEASLVIPVSVNQGGNGAFFLFNTSVLANGNGIVLFNGVTTVDTWGFNVENKSSYSYSSMSGKTINKIGFTITGGTNVDGFSCSPMFKNDGSTSASAFIPYSNICPISGLTGLSVYRTGANLFPPNPTCVYGKVRDDNGDEVVSYTSFHTTTYIPVKASTKYTLKLVGQKAINSARIYYLASDGSWISRTSTIYSTPTTFTTPSGCGRVEFQFSITGEQNLDNFDLYLCEGETATTEPFGNTYAVDWSTQAGTVYGGTVDVVTGLLTVDKVAVTINGSTVKAAGMGSYGTLNRFAIAYGNNMPTAKYSGSGSFCLSDKITPSYNNTVGITTTRPEGYYCFQHSSAFFVSMPSSTITSIAQANSWFAANTPVVCYELATPLTYQLTAQEVQMLLGENYVWSSSGDTVSVTYYAEGNANPLQSLNILLGGNYSNPKTADDVSDKEALEIILGGNK